MINIETVRGADEELLSIKKSALGVRFTYLTITLHLMFNYNYVLDINLILQFSF